MKEKDAVVSVYKKHSNAIDAIKKLKMHKFDLNHISIIGKGDVVKGKETQIEEDIHIYDGEDAMRASTGVGALIGGVAGLLTGIGAFAVPGLGILFLGGALAGAVGGTAIGAVGGGLVGLLGAAGLGEEGIAHFKEHVKKGRYLVMVHGTVKEVKTAHQILHDDTDLHEIKIYSNNPQIGGLTGIL
ncbi:MAG: hypothetical protein ACJAWV_002122 [Flammeovirgaceae bacterium]|jgi:hypothetical protein